MSPDHAKRAAGVPLFSTLKVSVPSLFTHDLLVPQIMFLLGPDGMTQPVHMASKTPPHQGSHVDVAQPRRRQPGRPPCMNTWETCMVKRLWPQMGKSSRMPVDPTPIPKGNEPEPAFFAALTFHVGPRTASMPPIFLNHCRSYYGGCCIAPRR